MKKRRKETSLFLIMFLISLNQYAQDPADTQKGWLQSLNLPDTVYNEALSGDRDAIRLEHSIKIFNNIENSNFFVMPGATHFGSYQKPELFNIVLLDFLNNPFSK